MADVPVRFVELIATVTGAIAGQAIEEALGQTLNSRFPAGGALLGELQMLCRQGCIDGWLCAREQGGIKFGRPVKPGPATHGFSVDVVEMNNAVGPHHRHPHGEVDLVMPLEGAAAFDGVRQGWKVYPPRSAHRPTVSGGKALVLYLLPDGAIEFTRE
jgi:hypothetical protein